MSRPKLSSNQQHFKVSLNGLQSALVAVVVFAIGLAHGQPALAQESSKSEPAKAQSTEETPADEEQPTCEDQEATVEVCKGDPWYTCVCMELIWDIVSDGWGLRPHPRLVQTSTINSLEPCSEIEGAFEEPAELPDDQFRVELRCIEIKYEAYVNSSEELTPSPSSLHQSEPEACDERLCQETGVEESLEEPYTNEDGELCQVLTRVRGCEPKQE